MKKVLCTVLVIVLVVAMLAACTAPSAPPATDSEAPASEPAAADENAEQPPAEGDDDFFVGLAFGGLDATPTVLMGYLTEKMDALGWKYVVTNGDLDMNKYLADVESLCQQKPDMIMTRPVNDTANASIVPICDAAKIPVAFMSSATVVEGYDYLGHVSDPELIRGVPLGNWIADYVESNAGFVPKIGIIVGAAAIDSKGVCERTIDVVDTLDARGVDYEVVISAEADPNWSAAGGMKVAEDWLQKYPIDELNTILCWSDEMCVGVVQALQAAGKNPDDYLVLSYDGLPIVEDYVKEGWIDATSALGLEKQADVIIEFCRKFKDGELTDADFQTYAQSIYVMDTGNIEALLSGGQPEYWDYSSEQF